jgi:hypothetical protein
MDLKKLIKLGALSKGLKFPLEIQYFAENDDVDDDSTKTDDSSNDDGDDSKGTKNLTEQEVNNIIRKRLAKERARWEKEQQDKESEADKFKKMTEAQKAEYKAQKKQRELDDRETALNRKELMSQAKETLVNKGIPTDMVEFLDFTDADSCNKSIEKLEKTFNGSLQKAVDEKIKGGSTVKKAKGSSTSYTKEQLESMSADEINKNWDAVQESMKNLD